MVLQDKTWSHPKNNLPNRWFGNPESGNLYGYTDFLNHKLYNKNKLTVIEDLYA
ncbi:hypothetical protein ES705_06655 [subsurface metagenome]|jgi:hypothetical protein|uniref:Uncharacterized protein n=1 Tax=marine sediment metagenome TaxID=412755 RepID=X1RIC8_9ZZZZ